MAVIMLAIFILHDGVCCQTLFCLHSYIQSNKLFKGVTYAKNHLKPRNGFCINMIKRGNSEAF